MADLVARYPERFAGFCACVPMDDAGAAVAEYQYARRDLGALGAQIYTHVHGAPMDRLEFDPFYAASASSGDGPAAALPVLDRLDEIPGIGPAGAQVILAEIGLDMTRFATAAHLVSWAKLCPKTIQSGAKSSAGKTGKANPYLKGILGEVATAAAKTDTFLGERYRRVVKRRGKLRALIAVARSILVIIWHLLADPSTRYTDLGSDYHANRIDRGKKARNHIRQLEALGFTVTLTAA